MSWSLFYMKYMSRNYEKSLRILLMGIGLFILCLAFYQVWIKCYNPMIRLPFYRRGNYMFTLMYGAILLVCVLVMKGNTLGQAHLAEVTISQCIALTMTSVIVYFPMSLLQYELLNPWPLLLLMLGQWGLIVLWNLISNRIYFKLVPPVRVLLIWDGKAGRKIAEKLAAIPQRYRVEGEVSIREGREAIRKAMQGYDAILLCVKDDEWRGWIVRLCFKKNMQLFIAPTLTDVIVNSAKEVHRIDTPMLCSTDHKLTIEERAIKRVMDIVCAVIALVISSPVLIITAMAIKLCDGGPIFFRQERLTRDGKVFKIIKFRSMIVDAEKHGQRLASEHDDRITPVGKVIRKLRIDEFPQFFNVLKGDMSLVGPRPECPSIAKEYEKWLPDFAYRLKVKAGITGYAQVYGDYATHPADKLMMDIMYIEKSNIVLDINLILLTVRALFMTDKTKGKTERQAETTTVDSEVRA